MKRFLILVFVFVAIIILLSCWFFSSEEKKEEEIINDLILTALKKKRTNPKESLALLDSAKSMALKINDSLGIGSVVLNKIDLALIEGDLPIAMMLADSCIGLFKELNRPSSLSICYNNKGMVFQEQFELDSANFWFKKSLELKRRIIDTEGIGVVFNNLAINYDYAGLYAKAMDHYYQAIPYSEKAGDLQNLSKIYSNMSVIYHQLGAYQKANVLQDSAMHISRQLNNMMDLTFNLICKAAILLKLRKIEEAQVHLTESLELARELNLESGLFYCSMLLSEVKYKTGHLDHAISLADTALKFDYSYFNPLERAEVFILSASIYAEKGFLEKSNAQLDSAAKQVVGILAPKQKMEIYKIKSHNYKRLDKPNEALSYLSKSNVFRDSFFEERKQDQTLLHEIQFATERKESENINLKKNNRLKDETINQQKQMIWIGALLMLALFVISYLIFKQSQNRKSFNKVLQGKNFIISKLKDELDHRLHNQMNQALGMLDKYRSRNNQSTDLINDLEQRLLALSTLSQLLSSKNMDNTVELLQYLSKVVSSLEFNFSSLVDIKPTITLLIDSKEISSTVALNLALIITELYTNSIKHAFPNIKNPTIDLSIHLKENYIDFNYLDNGIGIQTKADFSGEGMKLIDEMLAQIQGKGLIISCKNGFEYSAKILFKS